MFVSQGKAMIERPKTPHCPRLCALQHLVLFQGLCLQLRLEWQWYEYVIVLIPVQARLLEVGILGTILVFAKERHPITETSKGRVFVCS